MEGLRDIPRWIFFHSFSYSYLASERATIKRRNLKFILLNMFLSSKTMQQRLPVTSASSRDDRLCMPFDYSMKQFLHCVWHFNIHAHETKCDMIALHWAGEQPTALIYMKWKRSECSSVMMYNNNYNKGCKKKKSKGIEATSKDYTVTERQETNWCVIWTSFMCFFSLSLHSLDLLFSEH